jgi:hypothetical protein
MITYVLLIIPHWRLIFELEKSTIENGRAWPHPNDFGISIKK